MKKTLLIVCLSAITIVGYSQTKTPTKPAPKPANSNAQPAKPKATGDASTTEKIAKPANSASGDAAAPETSAIDNSKSITSVLLTSLLKSDNKLMDKELLSSSINLAAGANNNEDLYNAMRMVVESAPSEAYKAGNAESGRQIAGNFNSDLELSSYNSLLLKWEMLLNPACFDAAWKTNQAKWRKQTQGTK